MVFSLFCVLVDRPMGGYSPSDPPPLATLLFLALLRPIFVPKAKITPAILTSAMRNSLFGLWFWSNFVQRNCFLAWVKTFIFFGLHVISRTNTAPILGQDRFRLIFTSEKATPPISNSWVRAWYARRIALPAKKLPVGENKQRLCHTLTIFHSV